MGKEKVREVIVSLLLSFFIAVNFLLSVSLHLYAQRFVISTE